MKKAAISSSLVIPIPKNKVVSIALFFRALSLDLCWSHLVGESKEEEEAPIETNSHGRKAKSIFNPRKKLGLFSKWLNLLVANENSEDC